MTLGEALRALHAAGRIRSPWLQGMQGRSHASTARRVWTGWIWRSTGDVTADTSNILGADRFGNRAEPDLDDPATVGCLAALAREASGDAQPMVSGPGHPQQWGILRDIGNGLEEFVTGETEGEAWAAALIALAEEVAGG